MKVTKMIWSLVMCSFIACTSSADIKGTWLEPIPGQSDKSQGFTLSDEGKASSVNMATLAYETWQQDGNKLILTGKSMGNGQTIAFTDTFAIEKLTPDSLILKKQSLVLRYSRN